MGFIWIMKEGRQRWGLEGKHSGSRRVRGGRDVRRMRPIESPVDIPGGVAVTIMQIRPNTRAKLLFWSASALLPPFMSRPQDDRNQEATVYLVCVTFLIS